MKQGLCTACGGNHRWFECLKRPNASTLKRNSNLEASTSDCSHVCEVKSKQLANPIFLLSVTLVAKFDTVQPVASSKVPLESQVLSLLGSIFGQPVNILIDSGCTNNFVSTNPVQRLKLRTVRSAQESTIKLADGSILQCNTKIPNLPFSIQKYRDHLDFEVLPLFSIT